ncbi:hypothetical protein TEA_023067 [Camellia sinensis var. sinensis]|uniref:Uncharacterized protein n=1 Tax=Camellia sinensis var. sinensis TaxID=542762 RepID=A0A4S4F3A1_CAMSN|nr:hypothetical protein TEA_023067 [Camellia sinensis var. sinensis]
MTPKKLKRRSFMFLRITLSLTNNTSPNPNYLFLPLALPHSAILPPVLPWQSKQASSNFSKSPKAFDELGRPFITIKEQEQKTRLRGLDAQKANIFAEKAVARILRTSLGTKGMDKMLQSPDGELTIRQGKRKRGRGRDPKGSQEYYSEATKTQFNVNTSPIEEPNTNPIFKFEIWVLYLSLSMCCCFLSRVFKVLIGFFSDKSFLNLFWVSTREFVDVVFAYWVIFPDSEQQLINLAQDLVTSDALMEQIKALVYRHPDKLYMETTGGKNKGYRAEMIVVTYCRNRKDR